MSDYILAIIIPLGAIALAFAWVPFLNFICPPCARSLERRTFQREDPGMRPSMTSIRD